MSLMIRMKTMLLNQISYLHPKKLNIFFENGRILKRSENIINIISVSRHKQSKFTIKT